MLSELGITDLTTFITSNTRDNLPDVSRIFDLDGDNMCGASDASFILQFLNGMIDYPYNYNEMDVIEDGVIDKSDAWGYLYYFTDGMLEFPGAIPYTTTHSTGSYTSQTIQYQKYNSQTGAYLGTYSLTTPNAATASSATPSVSPAASPQTLKSFATDTRYLDWSKTGVVKLIGDDSSSSPTGYHGTGFIVGSHLVATAAHCVQGNKITKLRLFDEYGNKDTTFHSDGTITPLQIHYPSDANGVNCWRDYALITVQEDLSDYVGFSMGVPLPEAASDMLSVSVTGFPKKLNAVNDVGMNAQTVNSYTQDKEYTDNGFMFTFFVPSYATANTIPDFTRVQNGSDYITFSLYATNGNSGSPVYYSHSYEDETYQTVLGIMTISPNEVVARTYKAGPRITSDLLKFYYNNPNI